MAQYVDLRVCCFTDALQDVQTEEINLQTGETIPSRTCGKYFLADIVLFKNNVILFTIALHCLSHPSFSLPGYLTLFLSLISLFSVLCPLSLSISRMRQREWGDGDKERGREEGGYIERGREK